MKIKCSKCKLDVDLSFPTDRYCKKCGAPLFIPIEDIVPVDNITDGVWFGSFNSVYNFDGLVPSDIQKLINRASTWLSDIPVHVHHLARLDSKKEMALKRVNQLILHYRSFFRSGYAFGFCEKKLSGKNTNISQEEVAILINTGEEKVKKEDILNESWGDRISEDEKKLLYLAVAIADSEEGIEKYFKMSEGVAREKLFQIIADNSRWLDKEIKNINETVLFCVIWGYALFLAKEASDLNSI